MNFSIAQLAEEYEPPKLCYRKTDKTYCGFYNQDSCLHICDYAFKKDYDNETKRHD